MTKPEERKARQQRRASMQTVLFAVRSLGLVLLVGGLAMAFGFVGNLDPMIGYVLAFVGIVDLVILPVVIRRMFQTERDEFLAGKRPEDRPER
ncbi:hypothetical protein SAMN02745824_1260 [Parasphingorhabdus marina DSM 22363]|uniref:Uncharacterized protein n=1 Tax=Parasphingorhabdus marina DSM 22363 TaxID=1123272 RepID=A0A1N6CYG2_9SPHN|nr:hypothetical protein [Parasphingorhabdus marina]SIN63590.1 hypothetical protein SAMN02745824_1260 [Parasphingorhabdus marina DSM 22363]